MAKFVFDPGTATVELRPHKGFTKTIIGQVEVELPQKIVYVNGKRIGYVGNADGAPVQVITTGLPKDALDWIKAKVDELKGSPSASIQQASTPAENDVYLEKPKLETISSEEM